MTEAVVDSTRTRVLAPEFDRRYPVIVRGMQNTPSRLPTKTRQNAILTGAGVVRL